MDPLEVRAYLPRVPVRLPNGEIVYARTSGRLNEYCTVSIEYGDTEAKTLHDFRTDGVPWKDCHYTWEEVAEAIQSGVALEWKQGR